MDYDRINALIREARKKPSLCQEDERELLEKYQETGDQKAFERLVESHMKLVIAIARNYAGYNINMTDIIQEGNIGLIKAINNYDLSKENRLAVYAAIHIKAQIRDFILKDWSLVKLPATQRKLFFKTGLYKNNDTSQFDQEVIEELLGCDYTPDIEFRCVHASSHDVSLDATRRSIQGMDVTIRDNLIDLSPYANPETNILNKEKTAIIKEVLATNPQITNRECDILTEKYLNKESGEQKTTEIAELFKITRQRVDFLKKKAFSKLRKSRKIKELAA